MSLAERLTMMNAIIADMATRRDLAELRTDMMPSGPRLRGEP